MGDLNLAELLLQVFGERAAAWVAVVGVCLVCWSQLRAAIPQTWWEKIPRPLLVVLDVVAANWGSARNATQTGKRVDATRPADSAANTKLP